MNQSLLNNTAVGLRERKKVLDTALFLNAVGSFAALVAVWYLRALGIDLAKLAWTFFIYGAIHLIFAAITDKFRGPRSLKIAMAVAQFGSISFLAFAWHLAGGVLNPIFLLSMVVPVVVASALQLTRLAVSAAVYSAVVASAIGVAESEELRWFVERLGIPLPLTVSLAPSGTILPGVEMTPAALLVALGLFAAAQLALAFVGAATAAKRIALAERFAEPGDELTGTAHAAIMSTPAPTIVVYADTAQVHIASRSFINQMLLRADDIRGRTLFDLLRFDDEASVRDAIRFGGQTSAVAYYVGRESRRADLSIHSFVVDRQSFAAIRFNEWSDQHVAAYPSLLQSRA
jgi:hypothetical protein